MGEIILNRKSSADYGVHVARPPDYEIPERSVETISVPGRNGDLHISTGSYKNVPIRYEVNFGSLTEKFPEMADKFIAWLQTANSYCRIEDSYNPKYFRYGTFKNNVTVENILDHAGKAEIEFDCMPQRFLKTGETSNWYYGTGAVTNPTAYSAYPILEISGSYSGTVRIGKYSINVYSISSNKTITVDCELGDAYHLNENLNDAIAVDPVLGFPILEPGDNEISMSGGVNAVRIKPRWWTI